MPGEVSFEEAAALPVAYGTAHRMLITHATVKKGDRVLVLGASGGVGTGCVILAKHLGAEVIACASSAEKLQAAAPTLGADEAINYQEVDFSNWLSSGTASRSAAVMKAGWTWSFASSPAATPGSRRCAASSAAASLLVCGATAGYDPKRGFALRLDFRTEDHRLQQLLR